MIIQNDKTAIDIEIDELEYLAEDPELINTALKLFNGVINSSTPMLFPFLGIKFDDQ